MTGNLLYTSKSNLNEKVVPYLDEMSVEEPIVNGKKRHYFLSDNQGIEIEIADDLSVKITPKNLTAQILNELRILNCKSLKEK